MAVFELQSGPRDWRAGSVLQSAFFGRPGQSVDVTFEVARRRTSGPHSFHGSFLVEDDTGSKQNFKLTLEAPELAACESEPNVLSHSVATETAAKTTKTLRMSRITRGASSRRIES